MVREVLKWDKKLNKKSVEVIAADTDQVRQLAVDLIDTMRAEGGIGIAAPQISTFARVMVVTISGNPVVMVNPRIVAFGGAGGNTLKEGCLSFPGLFEVIKERSQVVNVEYTDLLGGCVNTTLGGIESVCFQHELDHLDGIVFIQKLDK